jgi:PAS domain-containing protein
MTSKTDSQDVPGGPSSGSVQDPSIGSGQALRRGAKGKTAPVGSEDLETLSPKEVGRLGHELRVHQIELEMQNEELRRAQEVLEASRARYFDLYDLAPVGYVTVSEPGMILEANITAATLLGSLRGALVRQPHSSLITHH